MDSESRAARGLETRPSHPTRGFSKMRRKAHTFGESENGRPTLSDVFGVLEQESEC
jgi:hypothetical protein